MEVKIKKLHPNAIIPKYATDGAACFDLHAVEVNGSYVFGAYCDDGYPVVCDTGLAIEVPQGFALMVYSRSGHGFKHGARLVNSVGVIDSDYRGSIKVKISCEEFEDSQSSLFIKPGDRIAQAMIIPISQIIFIEDGDLSETDRGDGGFGSTGQ